MSINVTVTGNPVYLGRGKVLLTDIEAAKKNEWLRRRKIRLQQARQQGKDLTRPFRRKVSCEEIVQDKNEENQAEEENKCRQEEIASLQTEFQESLNSIGTGHQLAIIQRECDAMIREKQELREAIAKARGAIAEERLKAEKSIQREKSQMCIGRKKMARQIEDLRSSLVTNLPEVKSSVSQTKKSILKTQDNRNPEAEEENAPDCERIIVIPTKKFAESSRQRQHPTARCSLSPPRSIRQPGPCRTKKAEPNGDSFDEEDTDDSDVTWPPRSARVTKEPLPTEPSRVRFYDHNSRLAKSSPRPSYSITQMDPFDQPDMSEAIAEEEEAIVRKENLDVLKRREKMIRGNKALRKERAKKEADKFLKEMRELNRKEKIQIAVDRTYPCDMHTTDFRRNCMEQRRQAEIMKFLHPQEGVGVKKHLSTASTTDGIKFKTCDQNYAGVKVTKTNLKSPPKMSFDTSTDNEEFFDDLVSKLKIERAKKQQELETEFGVKDINDDDIPHWVRCQKYEQETAGPSGIRVTPLMQNRGVSPMTNEKSNKRCSCSSRCTCCKHDAEENFQKQKEQVNTKNLADSKNVGTSECEHTHDDCDIERTKGKTSMNSSYKANEREQSETVAEAEQHHANYEAKDVTVASGSPRRRSLECEMVSSKCSSQSDTVESSLTFEGIKVIVKVCEKGKKKKDRLSEEGPQTTDKGTDIQTSLVPTEESSVNRSKTWNNQLSSTEATSSGSTSYMSPPSKLSPDQQSLLRAILCKIEAKNKNPKLHHYIKRVLEMSRKSLDDLTVSSVSDTSINSSIFDRSTGKKQKALGNSNKVSKGDVSCQANISSSDDSATKEVLKFSELAESYAHRVQDLAGMMDKMRILPDTRTVGINDDSSVYLSPPAEVHHSVRLSQSVKTGAYPKPADDSMHYCTTHKPSPCHDLPPSHIYPHPSAAVHLHPPPSLSTQHRRMAGTDLVEAVAHELSTIQEGGESQRPETPQPSRFDPDISSIRGSPQQQGGRDSTGSSLCLLDERDISSWLGSSTDDHEEVFRSLGIAWALPTVRKTRQSQRRASDSQSSSRSTGRGQYSHSTPLGPSPAKPRASCTAHSQPASTESESLTPPCLSLNIPASVWPKPRCSR